MKSLTNYITEKFSINESKILRPKSEIELYSMIDELIQECKDTKNEILDLNCIDVSALPEDFTNFLFNTIGGRSKTPIDLNDTNIKEIDISEWKIDSIGDYMFYKCIKLSSIIIPDLVTSIGKNAFYGCFNLDNLTIPDSVQSISDLAFRGCDKLVITVHNEDIKELVEDSGFKGRIIIK